jgi:serine/threonine protein kinase
MIDWEAFYSRFRQPEFLPGYEIGHRLGGGAFGDVYLARKRSIGKAYAVKFLKLEAGQQDAVERELEQVRLFAAIDHPNLVTIEDMGVAMGVPFLILGYAGEDTLARRLKRGELTRESALSFFVQACRGVLALHDRRLAHFDLKPSNIFLKGEVARVGDYGLARLLSEGRATLSFGRGTPQYMAPEMLRNRADHRADIYSLGVILYESMTGALPYPCANEFGLAIRESDDPPVFAPDFPAQLRAIVEGCLRLEPRVRYGSVNELLAELGQSARQGDSVVIPWTTNGLLTPVPSGAGAPTPPLPPPLPPSASIAPLAFPPALASTASAAAAAASGAGTRAAPPNLGAAALAPSSAAAPENTVGTRVRAVLSELRETRERAQAVLRGATAPTAPTASSTPTTPTAPSTPSAPSTPATPSTPSTPSGLDRRSSENRLLEKLGAARTAALAPSDPSGPAAPALAGRADAATGHGDVVSFQTLDEPDEPDSEPASEAVARFAAPSEIAREARRAALPSGSDALASWVDGAPAGLPALPSLAGGGATIPVPPRVEGGLLSSGYAVFVLGLEVLLTLIFGPLTLAFRNTQTWTTQLIRGLPATGSPWGRLLFMMVLMGLLGALCSSVLVFFLEVGQP